MGCNRKVELLFSEFFWEWEAGSKMSFFSADPVEPSFMKQTHLLYWKKKKLSDFGWTISLKNAEKHGKICQRTADILSYICYNFRLQGTA